MTENMEESSRIERTWRGRWWSGDCSPRGKNVAVGEDVDSEVGLETVVSEEQLGGRQGR